MQDLARENILPICEKLQVKKSITTINLKKKIMELEDV